MTARDDVSDRARHDSSDSAPPSVANSRSRTLVRSLLVVAFALAGYFHIAHPAPFLRITPHWVPAPEIIIFVTGVCELLGAAGLLLPPMRRLAGIMLALYSVCVFPANIQHALIFAERGSGWAGWLYHGPRLLFQPVIVWCCLFAGNVIDWPFTAKGQAAPCSTGRPRPHPRPERTG
ncbi:DoxX family protein [Sphingomonas sp.]|uniref:DoxX family protein n=1 Tax=Sphingomonas sp. TaxID=28214 RepID=UPI003B3A21F5